MIIDSHERIKEIIVEKMLINNNNSGIKKMQENSKKGSEYTECEQIEKKFSIMKKNESEMIIRIWQRGSIGEIFGEDER
jgi:hypothetical protein